MEIAEPSTDDLTAARRRAFVRRWITTVTIAEATGFAIASGFAVLTVALSLDDPWRLALLVVGGAVEGAALATGQYIAMVRNRPRAPVWIGATAVAASVAWLLGLLPSTLELEVDSPGAVALVVLGAVVLLASIPCAQWLALRRPRAFRWVPTNMAAWSVAVLWTAVPSPFITEDSPLALIASLYVVAGLLMAVTIAVLTAPVARSLFFDPAPGPAPDRVDDPR